LLLRKPPSSWRRGYDFRRDYELVLVLAETFKQDATDRLRNRGVHERREWLMSRAVGLIAVHLLEKIANRENDDRGCGSRHFPQADSGTGPRRCCLTLRGR